MMKVNLCISNTCLYITQRRKNTAADTRVINTNEADSRCAVPHGKTSPPHPPRLSVHAASVNCLSERRCADCPVDERVQPASPASVPDDLQTFGPL